MEPSEERQRDEHKKFVQRRDGSNNLRLRSMMMTG